MKTIIQNVSKQLINDMTKYTNVNIYIDGKDTNFQALAIPFYGLKFNNTSCNVFEDSSYDMIDKNGLVIHFVHIPNTKDDITFVKNNDECVLNIYSSQEKMIGNFWGIIRSNFLTSNILNEILGENNWTRDY